MSSSFFRFSAILFTVLTGAAAARAGDVTLARTAYPSNAGARAIASADFDRNGWPDLAHANYGRNTVTVLLNRGGSQGFRLAFDVPVGAGPFAMVTADFNLDGIADLAVANADGNSLSILTGRGDGQFTRTDLATSAGPRGLVAADMNRDGLVDLVYTAFNANRIQLLLGNGRGAFTAGFAIVGIAPQPQGLAAVDVNRDGTLDLAVAFGGATGGLAVVSIDRAGRPTSRLVAGPANLNLVAAADFDDDGWPDVAAAATDTNGLEIYRGGAAGLAHAASYSTGASPRGLQAADINQDGRPDLIAANRNASTVTLLVSRSDIAGTFDELSVAAGRGSRALTIGDFNGDGRIDVATGNQDEAAVTILTNTTDFVRVAYTFSRQALPTVDDYNSNPVAVADLNHNGIPDVVADSYILFDRTRVQRYPDTNSCGLAPDFNGDGHLDLICRQFSGVPWISLNDGNGTFTASTLLPVPPVYQSVSFADMNRDGRIDLILSTYSEAAKSGTLDIMLRQADGTWTSASRTTVPAWTLDVEFADLNNDGRLDVLTTYYQPQRVDVFLGDGGGRLGSPRSYAVPEYMTGIATGDINRDGAVDVVAGGWEQLLVFLGSPAGVLTSSATIRAEAFKPALVDMNMDGALDIVSGYTAILPGAGDGTFGTPEQFDSGVFYAAIADFNHDGLLDWVGDGDVVYNQRNAVNHAPVVRAGEDVTLDYTWQFGDEEYEIWAEASDPDLHGLGYEWTDAAGRVVGTSAWLTLRFPPGDYRFTVTVRDNRGAFAQDSVAVTIRPSPEIVVRSYSWSGWYWAEGSWEVVEDPTAADGVRAHDPNAGAPKLAAPLASPTSYMSVGFIADPTQTYKLWIRGKADNNSWSNDSVFLQFSGATDVDGTAVYRTGTTSGLSVNLEQCSGCGLSGWGWRDERWGPTLNAEPVLLRFPEGGAQQLVIQSREDGLSIDQIVLSAETYRIAPPGPPKNDTTLVPGFRQ